jgi:long-chain acyl-CoA synthetase
VTAAIAKTNREGPPATTIDVVERAVRAHPDSKLIYPAQDRWVEETYESFAARVENLARGLVSLGIEFGDRVAVVSDTRVEWTLWDLAAQMIGAIVVPIYQTSSPEECQYVLSHSGARAVLCENEERLDTILAVRDRCEALEHLVVIEGAAKGAMTLAELADQAPSDCERIVRRRRSDLTAEHPFTIIYTSGTTGPPKGCVITHRNYVFSCRLAIELGNLDSESLLYLWLPLAHAMARMTQLVTIGSGATLAFWRRDMQRLLDDLAELAPTHLVAVPRFFEKAHSLVVSGSSSPLRARALSWSLGVGRTMREAERAGQQPSPLLRARHRLAQRLVLARVKEALGGRAHTALTGAAPIDPEILDFFDACGLLVLEGYGLTETSAATSANLPGEFRFGTVGKVMEGTEIRLAGDDEILVRGPHVFAGYYRDEEATRAVLSGDGWLRTGDLGAWDDGYLRVTGRKKELIITSSGKNVAPGPIERAIERDPIVSRAVLFGDQRPYVAALVTIDAEEGEKAGLDEGGIRERVEQSISGVNSGLSRPEQVKRFAVLERDFSLEAGELTPTMKLKRNVIAERYATVIADLYSAGGEGR